MKFKKRGLKMRVSVVEAVQLTSGNITAVEAMGARRIDVNEARALLETMAGEVQQDPARDPEGKRAEETKAQILARQLDETKLHAEVLLGDGTKMLAEEGDWIAKHEAGNLYAYAPSVFEATYEAI